MNEEQNLHPNLHRAERASFARMMKLSVAFAIVLAIGFTGGIVVGGGSLKLGNVHVLANVPLLGDGLDSTPVGDANLADLWKVWHVLQARHVQVHASSTDPDTKKMIWGAIQGLTSSYGDPYTVFFPPAEAKVFQENIQGNFGGVGAEIGMTKDNILTVIAPLKGSPAQKAGIMAGDLIAAIDGKSTQGVSTDAAVKLIRGPKGSDVTFTIVRNQKRLDIKVTRDTIEVPSNDYSYDSKTGVFYIAIYQFTANSGDLFNKAFEEFKKSGSKKLIIDVRGDPGGYLDQAVIIASHFIPKGGTIVTEDYKGKQENLVHRSEGYGDLPVGTKVAVLMDQGSASASEILSGALQDTGVAKLVGTRSFGKGSVQELVDVDGGSLKVTVARWLTPGGRNISDGGLTADIKADRTQEDFAAGKDPQKERAVEYLTTGQ